MARVKRGTKTPGTAEEVSQEDKRIFPHKEQAVPVGTRGGKSRGSLCEARPAREEAAISPAVDSANRRGGAAERDDVRAADSRVEGLRAWSLTGKCWRISR